MYFFCFCGIKERVLYDPAIDVCLCAYIIVIQNACRFAKRSYVKHGISSNAAGLACIALAPNEHARPTVQIPTDMKTRMNVRREIKPFLNCQFGSRSHVCEVSIGVYAGCASTKN